MKHILTLILVASCSSSALAGNVERAWVDPNATWLVHVDFEGLMGSPFFQQMAAKSGVDLHDMEEHIRSEIHEELLGNPDIPPHVLESWHNMNFSFLDDMKSITVFGTDGNDEPSAVILQTTDAVDQIVATLDPIKGISVTPGENISFVALREPGTEPTEPEDQHVAAIRKNPATGDRTIIVADTIAKLTDELNLFAQQSGGGQNAGPAWASAQPGAYLLVHVSQEGLTHLNEEASRILGQAEQVHIEAGESAGNVFVDGVLEAKDAETVNSVVAIANGLMAVGRLGLASEPEGPKIISLINAVKITAQGNSMSATFSMPTQKLIDTLNSLEDMDNNVEIQHSTDEDGGKNVDVKVKVESE